MYAVMKEHVAPGSVGVTHRFVIFSFFFLDNRASAAQEGSAKSGFSLNRESLPGDDGLRVIKKKKKKVRQSPAGSPSYLFFLLRLNAALIRAALVIFLTH